MTELIITISLFMLTRDETQKTERSTGSRVRGWRKG